MKDIALVRSMTNKEGNHQRATYQLHTGYVPSATIKHPHIGCSIVSELGESKFDLPHIVSIGGPTIGAGFLAPRLEPFVVQNPSSRPKTRSPRSRRTASGAGSGCSIASRGRVSSHRRRRSREGPQAPLPPDGQDDAFAPDESLPPR